MTRPPRSRLKPSSVILPLARLGYQAGLTPGYGCSGPFSVSRYVPWQPFDAHRIRNLRRLVNARMRHIAVLFRGSDHFGQLTDSTDRRVRERGSLRAATHRDRRLAQVGPGGTAGWACPVGARPASAGSYRGLFMMRFSEADLSPVAVSQQVSICFEDQSHAPQICLPLPKRG